MVGPVEPKTIDVDCYSAWLWLNLGLTEVIGPHRVVRFIVRAFTPIFSEAQNGGAVSLMRTALHRMH